jgi:hypothetical protein
MQLTRLNAASRASVPRASRRGLVVRAQVGGAPGPAPAGAAAGDLGA